MYRYSQQMRQNASNTRVRMRVMAVLLILALSGCLIFGVQYARLAAFEKNTRQQLLLRMRSCCADTRNLAEKLTSSVQSNTASSLANIRQGIYAMDQINVLSIALYGQGGRMVADETFSQLYAHMDAYYSIIQTNTVSVLETRDNLVKDLQTLYDWLAQLTV